MKNFHKALSILAAAALFAGCSSYDETNDPARAGNTSVKLLADVADDAETRAGISVGESTFTGYWEENDAMGILFTAPGSTPELRPFTNNNNDFAFEGELPAQSGAWQYMAFYPHATVNGTKASIPFGNLRTQSGTSCVRPVYAAEDGTVDQAQTWDGKTCTGMQSYGNMVRLRHADYNGKKLQTRYAHLLKCVVELGDAVTEGQLIGYSGASGNCYGAHLHFEVLYKGRRVNPLNWLDADFTPASAAVRRHLGSYTSVARPADAEPAANALQTVQANGLTNAEAMSVYSLALALGLVGLGLYSAEYADAAHTKQNLRIGPVSAGDAKALMDKLTELGAADKAASTAA